MAMKQMNRPTAWWACSVSGREVWKEVILMGVSFMLVVGKNFAHVLPVKRQCKQPETFVVRGASEKTGECRAGVTGGVHRGETL
jgi:hypothetical protein